MLSNKFATIGLVKKTHQMQIEWEEGKLKTIGNVNKYWLWQWLRDQDCHPHPYDCIEFVFICVGVC